MWGGVSQAQVYVGIVSGILSKRGLKCMHASRKECMLVTGAFPRVNSCLELALEQNFFCFMLTVAGFGNLINR